MVDVCYSANPLWVGLVILETVIIIGYWINERDLIRKKIKSEKVMQPLVVMMLFFNFNVGSCIIFLSGKT